MPPDLPVITSNLLSGYLDEVDKVPVTFRTDGRVSPLSTARIRVHIRCIKPLPSESQLSTPTLEPPSVSVAHENIFAARTAQIMEYEARQDRQRRRLERRPSDQCILSTSFRYPFSVSYNCNCLYGRKGLVWSFQEHVNDVNSVAI
jgi:hypothetical protein